MANVKHFNLNAQCDSARKALKQNIDTAKEVLSRDDVHIYDVKIAISSLKQILDLMEIINQDFVDSNYGEEKLEPFIKIPLSSLKFTDCIEQTKFDKRMAEEQDKTKLISEIENIIIGSGLAHISVN